MEKTRNIEEDSSELRVKDKFEEQKNILKSSCEECSSIVIKFDKVEEKWLLIFDKHITGSEMNTITSQIANYFVQLNQQNIKILEMINTIYNIIEHLDKEYMSGILLSIDTATKIGKKAEKLAKKVEGNTKEIRETIEIQKETISILKQFKEQLEEYQHLEDIDQLWDKYQQMDQNLNSILKSIGIQKRSYEKRFKQNNKTMFKIINRDSARCEDKIKELYASLNKKIIMARWIAWGSLGVTLVSIACQIFGVF